MIFNRLMSIWILAVLIMVSVALTAWRQGAIRAAIAFVGILVAAFLAAPLGRLVHPLLPHLGFSNPITAWALAPVVGFILASIPFKVAAHMVHQRVEHFYKYQAGELRLALWSRLNTRLGICIGLLNGAVYFILISFFVFNLAYWTTQAAPSSDQPLSVRLVNSLGNGLQSSGFSKTANGVGTIRPSFYQLADLSGLLAQNKQLAPRVAEYPPFVPLWQRDEVRPLVTDSALTNSLASGSSISEIANLDSVKGLLANKPLTQTLLDAVTTNLDDLNAYLKTGQSAKYVGEAILGNWQFDPSVTLAWVRQDQPKMGANELASVRALWTAAYGPTTLLLTVDNQIFVKNWPKFVTVTAQNEPPFQGQDGKGDWSRDGANYSLHVNLGGDDKFMNATLDGQRLRIKDGHNLLIFDHVN
jgi:uncharacterized membrane protein required for colicin V production